MIFSWKKVIVGYAHVYIELFFFELQTCLMERGTIGRNYLLSSWYIYFSVGTIGVLTDSDLQYTGINGEGATVAWEPPAYFEVYCEIDLTFFPFDKHKCGIVVSGWTMTDTEMPVHSLVSYVNLDLYK